MTVIHCMGWKMAKYEIKIGGLGGQGVILSGIIIGRAAAIYDGKYATMTQSFGPEARGSAASSELVIDTEPVGYPYVVNQNILVVMARGAYKEYGPRLVDGGMLLYEKDLVPIDEEDLKRRKIRYFGIPATAFAEELGRRIVLNIVMMGFFAAVAGVVSPESMEKAVLASVPKGTEKLNLSAFQKGLEYGRNLLDNK